MALLRRTCYAPSPPWPITMSVIVDPTANPGGPQAETTGAGSPPTLRVGSPTGNQRFQARCWHTPAAPPGPAETARADAIPRRSPGFFTTPTRPRRPCCTAGPWIACATGPQDARAFSANQPDRQTEPGSPGAAGQQGRVRETEDRVSRARPCTGSGKRQPPPGALPCSAHGYDVLHATPLSVKLVGTAFVPFQVPLKPGAEPTEAPGAIEPLYERFVTDTTLPV